MSPELLGMIMLALLCIAIFVGYPTCITLLALGFFFPRQPGGIVQEQGNSLVEIALIAFDNHQVVALLVQNLLGKGFLCEQCIHRRDGTTQITTAQQFRCSRDLVGLRLDGHLS